MKTKIKNCVFWVLGVSFLFLSSCQKEDLELETKSHQHLKAEFISTNQLLNELKNPNVLDFVRNNLFISIEQNKLLRTNESNNLFQKNVLPEYTTYTYKIDYYNPLKPIIKYFIITKDKNGIEKACYVNYTPSNYTYKLDLSKFSGKLEMFTVENELYSSTVYLNGKPFKDNDPNKIQYQTEVCFSSTTITLVACTGGAGHSGVGETCFDGLPSNAFYSVSTTMTCIDTPGVAYIAAPSEYGGGGGGGGGGFEGINIPTPYQGEPDLGNAEWVFASQVGMFTNSLPAVVQNVLTQNWWLFPNIVQWFKENGGLTQQNKNAVAFALTYVTPVLDLYNLPNWTVFGLNQLYYNTFIFLLNNPNPAAANFVNQFVLNCNINHEINLNFDDSWRSPANIDRSSITNDTPEGQKFNEIYEELMKSPQFKDLFVRMFGVVNFINVKFDVAEIQQPAYGETQGNCQLFEYSTGRLTNKIIIDKSFILNNSKVEIARTIVHECIHAFLNVKLRHPSIGMPIANINNKDLANCINNNYNNFLNGTSHDFMIDKLLPAMVQILLEIKEDIFSTTQIANAENPLIYPIYQPSTTPPFEISTTILTWNWNEYFRYLCYQGLEMTSEFQFMFPNPSAALSLYYQYIARGNILFN